MGPAFVILFWLIILAIFGGTFLFLGGLSCLGSVKKWAWLKWGAGIPAGIMALAAIAGFATYIGANIYHALPSVAFKDMLGVSPSGTISEIKSTSFFFADSGNAYLRFRTSQEEFLRLVPEGFTRTSAAEMEKEEGAFASFACKKAWWTFHIHETWIYYVRVYKGTSQSGSGKHGFFFEQEVLAYDPQTQQAFYGFQGID